MSQHEGLMVSVSGVRGRVGEALSPVVVATFAAAFGAWARRARRASRAVVVGRDSRVSGPMFHRVVCRRAAVGRAADVIDIGLTTTPTCQLAVEHHHAAGGLMISASHNPIEWNALKFIGPSGLFLEAHEGAAMRALRRDRDRATRRGTRSGASSTDADAARRHLDAVLALPYLDVDGHPRAAIPGRARLRARRRQRHHARSCWSALGCEVTAINMEPDGRFPRAPEPVAENLGELEALVRESGADIGFAVDPDVDRLALVSEQGQAIGEDYTLALAAQLVLRHRQGPRGHEPVDEPRGGGRRARGRRRVRAARRWAR